MALESIGDTFATTSATTTAVLHEAANESGLHLSLAAERLGDFFGLPITNTLVTSWIVVGLLATIAIVVGSRIRLIPGRTQVLFEWLFETVYDYMAETFGSRERARAFFPLIVSVFLFIAVANLIEFTPGIGSITYTTSAGETVPFLRSMNTDLNMTLALTIIAVIVIEVAGVVALGFFRYAGKFINFSGHSISERLINFVVGIIELVSEISRLVSFSFRLFGNIFAGEVLIGVVALFVPYILPVPLMAFELFVGVIQGVVFAMLILFFVKLAVMDPHAAH